MSGEFPRRIKASVRDANGDPIPGALITWFVNGENAGTGEEVEGFSTIEVADPLAVVSVQAEYDGESQKPVKLAPDQQSYDFRFDVEVHPRWRQFFMKHFPAIVGVFFILLAIVLVFAFKCPSALQTRLILAMFALGGGGFGGEISGFLNTHLTLGQKLTITAGGAMAIFVLLFFFIPADAPALKACG